MRNLGAEVKGERGATFFTMILLEEEKPSAETKWQDYSMMNESTEFYHKLVFNFEEYLKWWSSKSLLSPPCAMSGSCVLRILFLSAELNFALSANTEFTLDMA